MLFIGYAIAYRLLYYISTSRTCPTVNPHLNLRSILTRIYNHIPGALYLYV